MNDEGRITAARSLIAAVGDAEQTLVRITQLTCQLLGVSYAKVSIVEDDQQVVLAQSGDVTDRGGVGRMPLSRSVCHSVVMTGSAVIIEDSATSEELPGVAAARAAGVAAYAGVPIRDADDRVLGSFCVLEQHPRRWTVEELRTLSSYAALAQDVLRLIGALDFAAGTDRLTGLMTRRVFEQVVDGGRRASRRLAFVAVGVDRLQLLNDAHGHAAGDALLVAMATRLRRLARDGDTVCRYGEDVFLVALDGPTTEITARAVAQRIRNQLSDETYDIDGARLQMTVTVGVAVGVPDIPAEIQIEQATEDLRRAKEENDGRRRHAPHALTTSARNRLQLQSALLGAASRGEMWLAYQPIVELDTGRCVSIESLVRWTHPELGAIGPNDFIPAAEASGAITEIGAWVINQACADVARWRTLPGHGDIIVSVNVAPFQLAVPSFAADVIAMLEGHSLPPTALAIEITERTLLASETQEHAALEHLHDLGVRIAIDDFGTGYSALSLLTTVPGDALKLDRSFVTDIATNTKAKQVTASILGIANGLDMLAIAEGIETEEQRQALIGAGYSYGQGYYFARPMPAEMIPDALSQAEAIRIDSPAP